MKNEKLITTLYIVYILHSMPMLGTRYPAIIYAFITAALFLLLLKEVGFKSFGKISPILLIPFLDSIMGLGQGDITYILIQISSFMQLMILPLTAIYAYRIKSTKFARITLYTFLMINFITCLTTYWGCMAFPNASRELTSGAAEKYGYHHIYNNLNIGGFEFIYSMVLIAILHIYTIRNSKLFKNGAIWSLLSAIYLIAIALAVVAAEYTTAIILLTLSLTLLVFKKKFNFKHLVIVSCIIATCYTMIKPVIIETLYYTAENIDNDNISPRLTDLALSLDGKFTQENSDMDMRETHYKDSFNAFINNPLGTWNFEKIGGHSYILDALGKYGILGFLLILIILYRIYKLYILPLNNKAIYGYSLIIFLYMIFIGTINPKLFTNIIMFTLPLYTLVIQERK